MSKTDYAAVSADFLKVLDMAQRLSKYGTPIEACQVQIAEVGSAAVSFTSLHLISFADLSPDRRA
jgi:hypothetical protein